MNSKLFTRWKESHPSVDGDQPTLDRWLYGTMIIVGIPLVLWGLWAVSGRFIPFSQ